MKALDDLYKRVAALEDDVKKLQRNAAPTVPIYDSLNFPQDAVEGQIAIAPLALPPLKTMNLDGKFIGGMGDPYGAMTFTMPSAGCWIYCKIKVDLAYFNDPNVNGANTAHFVELGTPGTGSDFVNIDFDYGRSDWSWQTWNTDNSLSQLAAADTWYTIEAHYDKVAHTIEWFVDGATMLGGSPYSVSPSVGFPLVGSPFEFGNISSPGCFTDVYTHLQDIRIGTARELSDIKSADLSTGDLSQFTSTSYPAKITVT